MNEIPDGVRAVFLDYDARPQPKTNRFCAKCQHDIKAGRKARIVNLLVDHMHIVHPDDKCEGTEPALLGLDCAKEVGLEWSTPEDPAEFCHELPVKARRTLIGSLRRAPGTVLSVSWYETTRPSNFDKYSGTQIKLAAEKAGFIDYRGGHPIVTESGHRWAIAQPLQK